MRLSRQKVRVASERAKAYMGKHRERIRRVASHHCRTDDVTVDTECTPLDSILFLEEGDHWAETDGVAIWINRLRDFTEETLFYTLLHEVLHGSVKRGRHELSEELEHRIMKEVDERLV